VPLQKYGSCRAISHLPHHNRTRARVCTILQNTVASHQQQRSYHQNARKLPARCASPYAAVSAAAAAAGASGHAAAAPALASSISTSQSPYALSCTAATPPRPILHQLPSCRFAGIHPTQLTTLPSLQLPATHQVSLLAAASPSSSSSTASCSSSSLPWCVLGVQVFTRCPVPSRR
jgi:hypothetical protein